METFILSLCRKVKVTLSSLIALLLVLCLVVLNYFGDREFNKTYTYDTESVIISAFYDGSKFSDSRLDSQQSAYIFLEPDVFDSKIATLESLSDNPVCQRVGDEEYLLMLGITDFNVSQTLRWEIDSPDGAGTLTITPSGVIKLPNGRYLPYAYPLRSYDSDSTQPEGYLGRIEEVHIPTSVIDRASWLSQVTGWFYFVSTANTGLTLSQVLDLKCGFLALLTIVVACKSINTEYKRFKAQFTKTH